MRNKGEQALGTLYLIPVPLGAVEPESCLPAETLAIARRLDTFIVERAKTARAHLKALGHPRHVQELSIQELNEHSNLADIPALLAPLKNGQDVGLMSEAGCPAVADPGAELVKAAHRQNITVVPLIGPSSVMLALMASGLNGQHFSFNGYLPVKEAERTKKIRGLENAARRNGSTQLFIETPYRSTAMLEALIGALSPNTLISVGADLSLPSQLVKTLAAKDWKGKSEMVKDKLVVFGIGV